MNSKDYLIVGQGIVGSLLGWFLDQAGKSFEIIDQAHHDASSKISAGMMNPITGKRFVLDPHYATYFSFAEETYQNLEEHFKTRFFYPQKVYRYFKTDEEKKKWDKKKQLSEYRAYLGDGSFSDNEDSFVVFKRGAVCDAKKILQSLKEFFIELGVYQQERFDYTQIQFSKGGAVTYQGKSFQKIIFCEGWQMQQNPFFDRLPFNFAKGEILSFDLKKSLLPEGILNKGKWCAKIGEVYKSGATYEWDHLNTEITKDGRKEIEDFLSQMKVGDVTIRDQEAGVRPILKDQELIMGLHPKHEQIGVLNGFASKGFLLSPYYANKMVDFLEGNWEIPNNLNSHRFESILC